MTFLNTQHSISITVMCVSIVPGHWATFLANMTIQVCVRVPVARYSLQARILEWVAIPFCRGSSRPRHRTQVSRTEGRFFTIWATKAEVRDRGRRWPLSCRSSLDLSWAHLPQVHTHDQGWQLCLQMWASQRPCASVVLTWVNHLAYFLESLLMWAFLS